MPLPTRFGIGNSEMVANTPPPTQPRLAGFAALEDWLVLKPVQPLTRMLRIGRSRAPQARDGVRVGIFQPQYEPADSLRGHF